MLLRRLFTEEVDAKLIHVQSVWKQAESTQQNTPAPDEIMASGERNKMCSCGVGSIWEADTEERQMR